MVVQATTALAGRLRLWGGQLVATSGTWVLRLKMEPNLCILGIFETYPWFFLLLKLPVRWDSNPNDFRRRPDFCLRSERSPVVSPSEISCSPFGAVKIWFLAGMVKRHPFPDRPSNVWFAVPFWDCSKRKTERTPKPIRTYLKTSHGQSMLRVVCVCGFRSSHKQRCKIACLLERAGRQTVFGEAARHLWIHKRRKQPHHVIRLVP